MRIVASDAINFSLHADGSMRAELGKRIAIALRDFAELSHLRNHLLLLVKRKVQFFNANTTRQLLYNLFSAWT